MPLFGPPDISKLKAQQNVKGLTKALTYKKDPTIRKNAAIALGEIGDPAAIPALEAAIGDEKNFVQNQVLNALGKIGTSDAVNILTSLLGNPATGVQHAASYVLRDMGETAVASLIKTVDKGNTTAKANAAEVLAWIKDPRAVDSLCNALQNPFPQVRLMAVYALKMIGDPRAVPALLKITNDRDTKVRDFVIETLGQLGDSGAAEALVANLSHPDESIHKQTVAALDRLNWTPTQDANGAWYWLIKGNWRKCQSIGEAAVEPLLSALKSQNPEVLKTAVIALGNMREPRALAPIKALLKTPGALRGSDVEVHAAAFKALSRIGGDQVVNTLINAYDQYSGLKLQSKIIDAMKENRELFISKLVTWLDGSEKQRENATEILLRLKATETIDPMLESIKEKTLKKKIYLKNIEFLVSFSKKGLLSENQKDQFHQIDKISLIIDYLKDKNIPEERFRSAANLLATLYKSDLLSETEKQLLLRKKNSVHYRISNQTGHVDNDEGCSHHWDYSNHTDKYIDLNEYL